jgi:hypothetical protein
MALTREQLVALREKILNTMAAPEEVRGGDGSGVRFKNAGDQLKSLTRIDAEIAALDAATGGGNSGTITRLYSGTGL